MKWFSYMLLPLNLLAMWLQRNLSKVTNESVPWLLVGKSHKPLPSQLTLCILWIIMEIVMSTLEVILSTLVVNNQLVILLDF